MKIVSQEIKDGATVFRMADSLEIAIIQGCKKKLVEVASRNKSRIMLDFTDVTYVSSNDLRVLFSVCKTAKENGSEVVFTSISERVRNILSIAGLLSMLTIV